MNIELMVFDSFSHPSFPHKQAFRPTYFFARGCLYMGGSAVAALLLQPIQGTLQTNLSRACHEAILTLWVCKGVCAVFPG